MKETFFSVEIILIKNLNILYLSTQEFGGKDYRKTSANVDDFVRTLISSHEMIDFETIRVFIDEDYSSDNKFTALGSFYFIHKTQHAFIWNFDGKFLSNRFFLLV